MRLIHDVCTDPDAPLQFETLSGIRQQCRNGLAYSGLDGAAHRKRYPDIQPAIFAEPPPVVFMAAYETARALNWHIMNARKWQITHEGHVIEGWIEATATTRLLRFKDDVVIRVRAEGSGTRLDMRSASRVGKTDLGANARRIRHFLSILKNSIKSNT